MNRSQQLRPSTWGGCSRALHRPNSTGSSSTPEAGTDVLPDVTNHGTIISAWKLLFFVFSPWLMELLQTFSAFSQGRWYRFGDERAPDCFLFVSPFCDSRLAKLGLLGAYAADLIQQAFLINSAGHTLFMEKMGQKGQIIFKTSSELQCLMFGHNCKLGSQYLSLKSSRCKPWLILNPVKLLQILWKGMAR